MTVIFACTFPGGAAIAADTLLHNSETGQRVMNSSKILNINQRVSIAQAGSFNETEEVWERLEQFSSKSRLAKTIDEMLERRGIAEWLHLGPVASREMRVGDEEQVDLHARLAQPAELGKACRQESARAYQSPGPDRIADNLKRGKIFRPVE